MSRDSPSLCGRSWRSRILSSLGQQSALSTRHQQSADWQAASHSARQAAQPACVAVRHCLLLRCPLRLPLNTACSAVFCCTQPCGIALLAGWSRFHPLPAASPPACLAPTRCRCYYTRLKLKSQIIMFNHLLEQQVAMVQASVDGSWENLTVWSNIPD